MIFLLTTTKSPLYSIILLVWIERIACTRNVSVVYGATIFCGGALVSWLVGSAPHRAAGFLRHCSWSRPLTLRVPLSIVY